MYLKINDHKKRTITHLDCVMDATKRINSLRRVEIKSVVQKEKRLIGLNVYILYISYKSDDLINNGKVE